MVKTYLRASMDQDRLNALALLSIQAQLVEEINDLMKFSKDFFNKHTKGTILLLHDMKKLYTNIYKG